MTCREKLKIEHPEKVKKHYAGGCEGCPHNYGYLDEPDYCVDHYVVGRRNITCTRCWDREILSNKFSGFINSIQGVLDELKRFDNGELKSINELLEENRELKKQLEEKDNFIKKLKDEIVRHFDGRPMGGFKE